MKIVVMKLTTGDEVIGTLVETTGDYVVLSKARTLVMQQMETGQIGLGMIPFMPSADNHATDSENDVKIYTAFVVAEPVGVPKPLEDAYIKTTSKIQLA